MLGADVATGWEGRAATAPGQADEARRRADRATERARQVPEWSLYLDWEAHAWDRCAAAWNRVANPVNDGPDGLAPWDAAMRAARWVQAAGAWADAARAWAVALGAVRALSTARDRIEGDAPFAAVGAEGPSMIDAADPLPLVRAISRACAVAEASARHAVMVDERARGHRALVVTRASRPLPSA